MSKARHETIADIVAALRAVAYIQTAESPRDVLEFANRIEAAANLEREAGAEAAQICGEIGEMIGKEATREKSSRVSNAAKTREALEEIVDMATCYFPDFTIPKDDDEFRGAIIDEAIDYTSLRDDFIKAVIIARAALAVPPRNCDRPECATTKAAQDVWRKEDGGKTAYYEWLLQQYKEGESEVNR